MSIVLNPIEYRAESGWALASRTKPRELARDGEDAVWAEDSLLWLQSSRDRRMWDYECEGPVNSAHLGESRVLVNTDSREYGAWGHLGPSLLLDRQGGGLVCELRGARGALVGQDTYLLGLEGYDVFDTWLYDKNGHLLDSWRSFGHYFPRRDQSIQVAECSRSRESRVVLLTPDGAILRGPALSDGQIPRPIELSCEELLILDNGRLRVLSAEGTNVLLARLDRGIDWDNALFSGRLELDQDVLTVRVGVAERTGGWRSHTWRFRVVHP